ncbi:cell division protein [Sphingomonas sp. ID1715]|uniref:cell division protein FtsX n=1 Tax=Sphingomonas sp. ID1715 TaxID=1656898 RepID=UPI00148993E1|nr:FtsX-like permease family protein [Sphingomonas sp. ID1715]NNM77129.1 cell division protein [Sphingomonas sp. ID1715]
MIGRSEAGLAERRLLAERRRIGAMPWVLAIMVFLTVLAAAAGLALASSAGALSGRMDQRVTIQIVEADPALRNAQAEAVVKAARQVSGVATVRRVPDEELARLVEPWLGPAEQALPRPALIDVDLARPDALTPLRHKVRAAAPAARVDAQGRWLAPLGTLIRTLRALALGIVLLTAGATAACVVLAARAALDTHGETIGVLHLLGATDRQIALLFQRRIAGDALIGAAIGFAGGMSVLLLLGARMQALGSELIGSVALSGTAAAALLLVPVGAALLATAVARLTIERALGRIL